MKRLLPLLYLLLVLPVSLYAKVSEKDFPFVHINKSNSNISYDGISRIFQDSRGFLWVGTFKGLNRYDGERFAVYDKNDFGVASDFIHSIEEDAHGNVWIGTDRGVVIYDYAKDSFIPFNKLSDKGTVIRNKVNNIKRYGNSVWLTANHQGLFCYDLKADKLVNFFVEDGQQTLPQGIRRFVIDSEETLWAGLYYNDIYMSTGTFDSLSVVDLSNGSFRNDNIEGLAVSREASNVIYAASVRKGLCAIDTKQSTVTTLFDFPDDVVPLEICLDPGKCIWIPTTRGLYRYDLIDNSYIVLYENPDDRFSLSDNYVYTVFVDNSGGVWAGTKDGGLNYSGPEQKNFTKYHTDDNGMTLENSIVSGFADDGAGTIWVTTEKSGLFRYDVESGSLSAYDKYEFKETICTPCWYEGYLWIGSMKGLIRLDVRSGHVKRYASFAAASVEDNKCYVVYRTDSGHLYVGTTLGLMKYDFRKDRFDSIEGLEGRFITGIDEDSRGRMWVSTYADGAFCFHQGDSIRLRRYQYPDGIATNKLSGIHVDGSDRVWAIGFSFGFHLFDRNKDTFIQYSKERLPNLQSDVFFSAVDDREGNLWLSSDKGIVRFDPASEEISTYTVTVGLLDDVMKKCTVKDSKGNMFFGSQNGFIRFNPEQFYISKTSPELVLSDFRIGDDIVKPGENSPLSCNVNLADEIILRPGQNSFGISASMLSLSTQADNKVMFHLEGYDSRPRILSSEKSVFWYNVPPGTYRLMVRGSNVNGKWNVSHKPLTIIVKRPLWMTPGAIVFYFLIVSVILIAVFWWYGRKLRAEEMERLEAFENDLEFKVISDKLPTIMLVTDDPQVRLQVKSRVEEDCNIVSVMSAKKALITLDNMKVDLVIEDLDRRRYDNEELCVRMKENENYSRVPVIVLSSDTSTKKKVTYMDMGVSVFLDKPFSEDYLNSCIRNIFNKEKSIESAISKSIVSMKIHRLNLDSKDEDFLNQLEKAVMDNLSNSDFDSASLESAMSMSRSSLVRRMKAILDTTPNDYIKKKRLSVAARMLEEKNVRVNEICYAVGFKYPSYFTKCFKEVYGLIPADYRKKCSKNIQKCPTSQKPL